MKKRILAAFLSVCMALPLAACGTSTGSNTSPAAESSAPASSAASSDASKAPESASADSSTLEPVELTWYFPGAWPVPDQDLVFEELNKMLKEKINVTVKFIPTTYAEYNEKMNTVISSGDNYDICFTANWLNNYAINAGKGAFLDLTDLLPEYMPLTYKQVPETFWDAARIKGRIYSVINEQVSARIPDVTVPTEFLTEMGYDLAKEFKANDITSLEPFLAKMKEKYPDKYSLFEITNQAEYLGLEFLGGFAVPGAIDINAGNTTVINQFKAPSFLKFVADLRAFNEKGYLDSNRLITMDPGREESKEKKQIVTMSGTYKPGVEKLQSDMIGFPFTVISSGKPILTTGGIIATMMAINKNSKNPERALMMLELFNANTEGTEHNRFYDTLTRGIEGVHFNYTDDGHIERTQKGLDSYNVSLDWMFASNFQVTPDVGMDLNIWDETRKLNAEATVSPLCGYLFDSEPVKTEVASCSAVIEEYRKQIQYGMLSEDDYNKFLEKLDAAGSEKIMAEMQTQVDAWLASK